MKDPFGKNQASSECDSDPEHVLQITRSEMNDADNNPDNFNSYCNQEIASANLSVRRKTELSRKSVPEVTNGTDGIHSMIEQDHGVLKDILKESLDGVYQQLEEIKQNNETQFRKIDEKNNERFEKYDKEAREAMKLQHRGIRKRLERLENKINSGYFN